jgi:hypothetical protein
MIFVSEGSAFSPVIEVEDGTTVLWEFDDETTSTAMATREFNTADAFDPAAWSNTGTPGWVAFTIIINPL